jgi:tetratricopeptide (TPR) repeat protein
MQLHPIRTWCPTLAMLTLMFANGCGANPAIYVAKGKKNLDQGRYADAEINFQKAVQKNPNLEEAWFGLGVAQFREKKLGDAYTNLKKASDLMPSREDVTIALADVSLALYMVDMSRPAGLYKNVRGTSESLLKRDPNSYDGLRFKGYIAVLDRRYPDAIDSLRKADSLKPNQGDVTQALVESLIKNEQGAEAEIVGQAFLKNVKDFGPVYDLLYGYYTAGNRGTQAEELLKTKIANNPDVLAYRLQLARHYLDGKRDDQMTSVLQQVTGDPKRFPAGQLQVGNFYASANRPDEALRVFQKGASNSSGSSKIAFQQRAAETQVQLGKSEEALQVLESILAAEPANVAARILRASINLAGNDPKKLDAAFTEFQQLAKQIPNDASLHYSLGRANLAKGNNDAAMAEFSEAIKLNPNLLAPRLLAAAVSMQKEDYKGAARYADEVLARSSDNAEARLLRAGSLTGLKNFEQASAEVDRLNRQYPTAVEPKLQLAALKVAQKQYVQAEDIYKRLYEETHDARPLAGLVDTYLLNNQYDTAIAFLNQQKGKSDSAQIDALLADCALRAHKLDLAVEQYSKLAEAHPNSYRDHLSLGDALLQKGNLQAAVAQFQTAKSLAPKDAETNAMLALALHNAGRTGEAAQAYRDTLALQSGNPLVMNNLAYLMAETGGDLNEAQRMAQDATRQQPSNMALADTLGWIYVKEKLPDSAIQVLRNAVDKDPDTSVYHYHLAVAFNDKGDKAGARKQLEAALANHPSKDQEAKIRELLAKI